MTLTELFNPSFFMLLGILLLALSFLIFYFENKAREQNHKINSMFSLVSSITEELNNANMRIHYLMNGGAGIQEPLSNIHTVSIPSNTYDNKIEVSEDEDDDDDDEDDDEDDEEDDDDEDEDDENDEDEDDTDVEYEDDIDDDKTYYQGSNHKEKSMMPTLEEFSDLDEDDSMNGIEEEPEEKKETKILTIHNENEENKFIPLEVSSDLKSIHISLDNTNEHTDYKKLSVQQLKNVVVQKGLAGLEEANKMKKGELHKLLGELNV